MALTAVIEPKSPGTLSVLTEQPAVSADDGGVWVHADMPKMWHRAMYDPATAAPVMKELFAAQMRLLRALASGASDPKAAAAASGEAADGGEAGEGGALGTFVEVGCGTSEAGSRLLADGAVDAYVGVDLSATFLELSAALHPVLRAPARASLLQGDASRLEELVTQAGAATPLASEAAGVPSGAASTASGGEDDPEETGEALVAATPAARAAVAPCMVGCVMNTMGILPDFIRARTVVQMIRLAKPGGTVVVGCWSAGKFAEGVERFYKRHPELCGVIDDSMVDIASATLVNPAGPSGPYTSQWWSDERVLGLFPAEISPRVRIIKASIGVFAVLRVSPADIAASRA